MAMIAQNMGEGITKANIDKRGGGGVTETAILKRALFDWTKNKQLRLSH